ncbi:glycosyltransferase family 4 protein [Streptomyces sp. CA-106110]|uniref:glycosyltransferase family 4 protein n=1 Tax=Streptomyces sp. CA-106110 TaxID=3240044 RepID=UPI003D93C850
MDQLAGMHVLFLNWRDPSHPQAGGAETYCFEIARRWAEVGVQVTLFTSRYPGAASHDSWEGVSIRRNGGTFGVYSAAARHLRGSRREYDAVVDFQNGIPFFSPLFAPRWTARVCVIHHVHQDQFDLRFDWPLNMVGRVLEKQASRLVYRGCPIVAVSPSTREEVRRRLGFNNPIYLVPNGAPPPPEVRLPRSATPTIAVVNRLVPHKRIDLLLQAVPALLRRWPDLHIDIAGDGSELEGLQKLAAKLGLGLVVDFHGHVDEDRKRELLTRAWLTVVPSRAEGWGLAVIEANSMGTPALAFEVPGLRDAIQDGRNGWLLPPSTDLAEGIHHALDELSVAGVPERMAHQCLAWAAGFSWDDSAVRLAEVVLAESRRVQQHRKPRRKISDLSVVAQFEAEDGDALERVMKASLQPTDAWIRRENAFRLLLHGCDEVLALKKLRRLGVEVEEASVTLAKSRDLLHGIEKNLTWPPPTQPV